LNIGIKVEALPAVTCPGIAAFLSLSNAVDGSRAIRSAREKNLELVLEGGCG
jgi:hypothetical protein